MLKKKVFSLCLQSRINLFLNLVPLDQSLPNISEFVLHFARKEEIKSIKRSGNRTENQLNKCQAVHFPGPKNKKAFVLCITHAGVNPCILVSNARDSQRSFSGDKCVDATRGVSLPCFLLPAGRYQLVSFCPLNCRPRVKLRIEMGTFKGDFTITFLQACNFRYVTKSYENLSVLKLNLKIHTFS